ncbi:MAG: glycerol-3-phosphate 1-O-acyltransferase PlsY [Planctomycetota bacterium]
MNLAFVLLLAYAIGCISFASLISRARGVDIRSQGSGNPGATNVGRVLGKGWGRAVLLLDLAKGFLPVYFLRVEPELTLSPWLVDPQGSALILAAVVLGHVYPLTSRLRGGKGVATLLGGLLALQPWWLVLVALGAQMLVRRLSGYVSLGSVVMAWTVPLTQSVAALLGGGAPEGPALTAALALLVTLRHADNFGRIRAGTESRHGRAHPPPPHTPDTQRS